MLDHAKRDGNQQCNTLQTNLWANQCVTQFLSHRSNNTVPRDQPAHRGQRGAVSVNPQRDRAVDGAGRCPHQIELHAVHVGLKRRITPQG